MIDQYQPSLRGGTRMTGRGRPSIQKDVHTPSKLDAFLGHVAPRMSFETLDRLFLSLDSWHQYLAYLAVVLTRFRVADAAHRESSDRLFAPAKRDETIPPAEWELHNSNRLAVQLEIESFYVFAKILLDRAADTFALYFGLTWTHLGSTHSHFTKTFPAFCAKHSLDGHVIQKHLSVLATRIVSYRTDVIEHLGTKDARRGLGWSRRRSVTLSLAGRSSEELAVLLRRLDRYLIALLTFMRAHAQYSILNGGPR